MSTLAVHQQQYSNTNQQTPTVIDDSKIDKSLPPSKINFPPRFKHRSSAATRPLPIERASETDVLTFTSVSTEL